MNIFREIREIKGIIKKMQHEINLLNDSVSNYSNIIKANSDTFRNFRLKMEYPFGRVTRRVECWRDFVCKVEESIYAYDYIMINDNLEERRFLLFESEELYSENDFEITCTKEKIIIIKNKITKETYLINEEEEKAIVKLPDNFDICENNDTESL